MILRNRDRIFILISHAFYSFDICLYVLISPFMAHVFFPQHNHATQIILMYTVLATSSIGRIFAIFVFARLCDKYNPLKILKYTLIGCAIISFATAVLPGFNMIGYYSVGLLCLFRFLIVMFTQGEHTIASIYMIDHKTASERMKLILNTLFVVSSTIAFVGATLSSSFFRHHWRIPFIVGGFLILLATRLTPKDETMLNVQKQLPKYKVKPSVILLIVAMNGLNGILINLNSVFLNTFLPMVTDLAYSDLLIPNWKMLLFEILIPVPIILLFSKRTLSEILKNCTLFLAIVAIPLFFFLSNSSIYYVRFVRIIFMTLSVIFGAIFNVYILQIGQFNNKYFTIGLSGALGLALIGETTAPICLLGFKKTHMHIFPGAYLTLVAIGVFVLLRKISTTRSISDDQL